MTRTSITALLAAALAFTATPAAATDDASTRAPAAPRELTLPGPAFFPESISAAKDGTRYVSSLGTGEIARFAPGAAAPDVFVAADVNVGTAGVAVDEARQVLWACEVDLQGGTPSRLKAFDLGSGDQQAAYTLPTDGLCGDITVGRDVVYVSDSGAGRILRLTTQDPYQAGQGRLDVWSDDPALADGSPLKINGIAFDGSRTLYTTNYATGELLAVGIGRRGWALEPRPVTLDEPLTNPDGLRWRGASLYVTAADGVSRVDPRTGQRILVANGLDQPTSLTFIGSSAWVTEGQVGRLLAGEAPDLPFTVAELPVRDLAPTNRELAAAVTAVGQDVRSYAAAGSIDTAAARALRVALTRAALDVRRGDEVRSLHHLSRFVSRAELVTNASARRSLVDAAVLVARELRLAGDIGDEQGPEVTVHDLVTLPEGAEPNDVTAAPADIAGRQAVRVALTEEAADGEPGVDYVDMPTFLAIPADLTDGTLEVDVLSRLNATAPPDARAFAGLAYRISDDRETFESVYLRPLNGLKTNPPSPRDRRAVQYFAYPDWKFDRLREVYPDGRYEAAADIGPDEWITLRVRVDGDQLTAWVNGEVALDLDRTKGSPAAGDVGLFVDIGTEAYFSDLRVTRH